MRDLIKVLYAARFLEVLPTREEIDHLMGDPETETLARIALSRHLPEWQMAWEAQELRKRHADVLQAKPEVEAL